MQETSASPLLLFTSIGGASSSLGLPAPASNLFDRLIRDPQAPNRPAREKLCVEMLCAVLLNTAALRLLLLREFARRAGFDEQRLDTLQWHIDTELPIGLKRDDLRIEGAEPGATSATVLWTIEAKVRSGFHDTLDEVDGAPSGDSLVNQLEVYDRWLTAQTAAHRCGFVLSLRVKDLSLPENLKERWERITWTGLGATVERALRERVVPAAELALARHFAGFVRKNLWEETEMPESTLTFDELALLRAFPVLRDSCEQKIDALVSTLPEVFEARKIGSGPITMRSGLFDRTGRSYVSRSLNAGADLTICAGIGKEWIQVWLHSPARGRSKATIRRQICARLNKLQGLNPDWWALDQHEGGSWDAGLERPLALLLGQTNASKLFRDVVAEALDNLKRSRVLDALRRLK